MIHMGQSSADAPRVLPLLKRGDIVTHCMRLRQTAFWTSRAAVRRDRAPARVIFDLAMGARLI